MALAVTTTVSAATDFVLDVILRLSRFNVFFGRYAGAVTNQNVIRLDVKLSRTEPPNPFAPFRRLITTGSRRARQHRPTPPPPAPALHHTHQGSVFTFSRVEILVSVSLCNASHHTGRSL